MKNRGFTLVELVVVIVLLGIVGTISFRFVSTSTQVYQDHLIQQQRIAESRFVLERLSREIVGIHPVSLRDPFFGDATYQGKCIEYIRLSAVAPYLNSVQGQSSVAVVYEPVDSVDTSISNVFVAGRKISIATQSTTDFYSANDTDTVKTLVSYDATTKTFQTNSNFTADSNGHRYTVLDAKGPVTWCVFNSQLYRYQNYNQHGSFVYQGSWFASEAHTGSSYSALMAEHLTAESRFEINVGTLSSNTSLAVSLVFATDDEGHGLAFNRVMQVNYVP